MLRLIAPLKSEGQANLGASQGIFLIPSAGEVTGSNSPVQAGDYIVRVRVPSWLGSWAAPFVSGFVKAVSSTLAVTGTLVTENYTVVDDAVGANAVAGLQEVAATALGSVPDTGGMDILMKMSFGGGAEGVVVVQSIPDWLAWMNFLWNGLQVIWKFFLYLIQWFKLQIYHITTSHPIPCGGPCPSGQYCDGKNCVPIVPPPCPSGCTANSNTGECECPPRPCPSGCTRDANTGECNCPPPCPSQCPKDPSTGKCNCPPPCSPGYTYDPVTRTCKGPPVCPSGQVWSPALKTCVSCQAGFSWDESLGACVYGQAIQVKQGNYTLTLHAPSWLPSQLAQVSESLVQALQGHLGTAWKVLTTSPARIVNKPTGDSLDTANDLSVATQGKADLSAPHQDIIWSFSVNPVTTGHLIRQLDYGPRMVNLGMFSQVVITFGAILGFILGALILIGVLWLVTELSKTVAGIPIWLIIGGIALYFLSTPKGAELAKTLGPTAIRETGGTIRHVATEARKTARTLARATK